MTSADTRAGRAERIGRADCREHLNGLRYPDGSWRCWRHASDADRLVLHRLDRRGASRGIKISEGEPDHPNNRAWPYGPDIDVRMRVLMLTWAENHGLALALPRHRCLDWLQKGRCAKRVCHGLASGGMVERWADHVTTWTHDGRPAVLVSQPYYLDAEIEERLHEVAAERGLYPEIDRAGGWYGLGTTWIALWRDTPVATDDELCAVDGDD